MEDGTTRLLGLRGLAVVRVEVGGDGVRTVYVVTDDQVASACPGCGVFSSSPKGWVVSWPADIPYGEGDLRLCWRKRRWRCVQPGCARESFTESVGQVPPRARTTGRLRAACVDAVAENRCVAEVARFHRVSARSVASWVRAEAAALGDEDDLPPVSALGMDETRRGRARWVQDVRTHRWELCSPWLTGFVDLASDGYGLLGQCPDRQPEQVSAWLAARPQAWLAGIDYVVIDPSKAYRKVAREVLPQARIVVDRFHLDMLANRMVTDTRIRLEREGSGRRPKSKINHTGTRKILLKDARNLSDKEQTRLNAAFAAEASGQLKAVWHAKELFRSLCRTGMAHPYDRAAISHALHSFYTHCADSGVPEAHRFATTIDDWLDPLIAAFQTGLTNARSEGINRLIQHIKRTGCGFSNTDTYTDRIRLRMARARDTRRARTTARPPQTLPG